MIEPQAGVAAPRVPEVIPEGIDPLVRMECAYSVGPALIDEAAEGEPDLGAKERVVNPALRLVDVKFGRHDVEIAGEHHRHGTPISRSSAACAERRSNHLSL